METLYGLIRVETDGVPADEQVRELVFVSDEYAKCHGNFLSRSSFSFMNNNTYSYTHYFIEEIQEVRLCGDCNEPLGPDKFVGDEGWSVCEECNAVESSREAFLDENGNELIDKL